MTGLVGATGVDYDRPASRMPRPVFHEGARRTDMLIGSWNHHFTHVPIAVVVSPRKRIDPEGALWSSVLATTGQPGDMR